MTTSMAGAKTEPSMRFCVDFKGRLSMLRRSTVIFGASMAPSSVLLGAPPEHLKKGTRRKC
ncbi:MAG: hypothetical protein ABJF25_24310 [Rhodopirellula bahusiensis]